FTAAVGFSPGWRIWALGRCSLTRFGAGVEALRHPDAPAFCSVPPAPHPAAPRAVAIKHAESRPADLMTAASPPEQPDASLSAPRKTRAPPYWDDRAMAESGSSVGARQRR